jgi:hypothetical protein
LRNISKLRAFAQAQTFILSVCGGFACFLKVGRVRDAVPHLSLHQRQSWKNLKSVLLENAINLLLPLSLQQQKNRKILFQTNPRL